MPLPRHYVTKKWTCRKLASNCWKDGRRHLSRAKLCSNRSTTCFPPCGRVSKYCWRQRASKSKSKSKSKSTTPITQIRSTPLVTTDMFRGDQKRVRREIRRALALDESLTAATTGALPPPADIDALPVDLGRLDTVEPLDSVHDLIDAVSEIIGSIQSPMQLERVLDGISRFRARLPRRLHGTSGSDSGPIRV